MAEKELTRICGTYCEEFGCGAIALPIGEESDDGDYYRADEADAQRQRERAEYEQRIAALEAESARLREDLDAAYAALRGVGTMADDLPDDHPATVTDLVMAIVRWQQRVGVALHKAQEAQKEDA